MCKYFLAILLITSSYADEMMLSEINKLVNGNDKKIILINKNDLNQYLKDEPKQKDDDLVRRMGDKPMQEIVMTQSEPVVATNNDSQKTVIQKEAIKPIKEVEPIVQKEAIKPVEVKKQQIIVSTPDEFIKNIDITEKDIRLNLNDLLLVTKHLFEKNLQSKYYSQLKKLLLDEATKNKQIDYLFLHPVLCHFYLNTTLL